MFLQLFLRLNINVKGPSWNFLAALEKLHKKLKVSLGWPKMLASLTLRSIFQSLPHVESSVAAFGAWKVIFCSNESRHTKWKGHSWMEWSRNSQLHDILNEAIDTNGHLCFEFCSLLGFKLLLYHCRFEFIRKNRNKYIEI